jgi:hypothetical protein
MACQVVVERDGNGEALPAAPGRRGVEQALGGNDVEVAANVSNLTLEEPYLVRWDELASRIAGALVDAVVHERGARLPCGEPEEEHSRDAERDTDGTGDEALSALG